ncbi:28S ribosomal protein S23, mitochondrial-like isoform X2 [Patiria miniata]|nr:28S ribosomal protein S23, mitochondrial-like isoform X2 [Patiria miniata]
MRAGVMKETDKPLWYDVMAAFPPRDAPTFNQDYKKDFLPEILYEEDAVRSQFYKVYSNQTAIDLTKHEDIQLSPCHRFITKYQELQREGTRLPEELFEVTAAALAEEGLVLRKRNERRQPNREKEALQDGRPVTKGLAQLLKQALDNQSKETDTSSTTIGGASTEDKTNR